MKKIAHIANSNDYPVVQYLCGKKQDSSRLFCWLKNGHKLPTYLLETEVSCEACMSHPFLNLSQLAEVL